MKATREIPLTRGMVALVDEADYDRVAALRWHAVPAGKLWYAMHAFPNGNGRRWKKSGLHTFLTGFAKTDHVNGDGLDNRRANLREATQSQNMANVGLISTNRSGYRGVSWCNTYKRWYACIRFQGRRFNLGYYDTPEEAAVAYDSAAIGYFGEFAHPNFAPTNGG